MRVRVAAIVCASLLLLAPSASFAQSQWGPSVGFMLGKFDSNDLSPVDKLVEEITGYDSTFRGRSWDLCAARGRADSGQLRICYTQIKLDDGSGLSDEFSDGVTDDGAVKGFKVDKTFRIGPSRWPVAPAVSLHGGLGKVSGDAVFTVFNGSFNASGTFVRTSVRAQERHKLQEYYSMLGEDWTLIGGGSIGVTAALGNRATVNFGIWGVELPGAYVGQVQVTFWP
jgi:hypothetical protein